MTTATLHFNTYNPADPEKLEFGVSVSKVPDINANLARLDIAFKSVIVTPGDPPEVAYTDAPISIVATVEDLKEMARKLELILQ